MSKQALKVLESELKRAHKLTKKIRKKKLQLDALFVEPQEQAFYTVLIDAVSHPSHSTEQHLKFAFLVECDVRRILYQLSSILEHKNDI